MRLWHIDLIDVLPRQQLLGQWRELNSIFKKQDKHILINYIYEYGKRDLDVYSLYVIQEMYNRGYKFNLENYCNYFYGEENQNIVDDVMYEITSNDILEVYNKSFKKHHNREYLIICYWNLREKYLRGGITEEEWQKVDEKYKRLIKE